MVYLRDYAVLRVPQRLLGRLTKGGAMLKVVMQCYKSGANFKNSILFKCLSIFPWHEEKGVKQVQILDNLAMMFYQHPGIC